MLHNVRPSPSKLPLPMRDLLGSFVTPKSYHRPVALSQGAMYNNTGLASIDSLRFSGLVSYVYVCVLRRLPISNKQDGVYHSRHSFLSQNHITLTIATSTLATTVLLHYKKRGKKKPSKQKKKKRRKGQAQQRTAIYTPRVILRTRLYYN